MSQSSRDIARLLLWSIAIVNVSRGEDGGDGEDDENRRNVKNAEVSVWNPVCLRVSFGLNVLRAPHNNSRGLVTDVHRHDWCQPPTSARR